MMVMKIMTMATIMMMIKLRIIMVLIRLREDTTLSLSRNFCQEMFEIRCLFCLLSILNPF